MTEHAAQPLSEHARRVLDEAGRADGTPPVSDQALIAVAQGKRRLVEFSEAIGIVGEGEIDLVVAPGSRGRGIGRETLRQLLSGEDPARSPELRAWAHGENPAAEALLRGAGFEPVRLLLRMTLRPELLAGAIEAARPLPDGFVTGGFQPGSDAQADDWVRVNAAAFASHPEQGKMTRADFDAITAEPWFIAEDLRLAYPVNSGAGFDLTGADEPAALAGFAWVKTTEQDGLTNTELYALGVDPAYAGIGLGAALLGETLRRMAAHRPDRISLYVDGDNENAVALYARAGFEIEQRSTQYLLNSR